MNMAAVVGPKSGSLEHYGKRGWRRNANFYTKEEDITIICEVVARVGTCPLGGRNLWMKIAESGTLPDRTWQSIKERFRKSIYPNITNYEISDTDKQILKNENLKMRVNNRRKSRAKDMAVNITPPRKRASRRLNSVKQSTSSSSSSDSSVEIDDSDWEDVSRVIPTSESKVRKRKLFSEESLFCPVSPIQVCTKPKNSRLRKCKVQLQKLMDPEVGEDGSLPMQSAPHCAEGPRLQENDGAGDPSEVLEDQEPSQCVSSSELHTFPSQRANKTNVESGTQTDLCIEESVNHVSRVEESSTTGTPAITSVHSQSGDGETCLPSNSTRVASRRHRRACSRKQRETNVKLYGGERILGEHNVVIAAKFKEQTEGDDCDTPSDWTMVSCSSEMSCPEDQDSVHGAAPNLVVNHKLIVSSSNEHDSSENLSLLNRLLENEVLAVPGSSNGTLLDEVVVDCCSHEVTSISPLKEENGFSSNSSEASLTEADSEHVQDNCSHHTDDFSGDEREPLSLDTSSFEVCMVSKDQGTQKSPAILRVEDSLDKLFSDSNFYEEGCCLQ